METADLRSPTPDLWNHARKLSQQARDPFPHYEHTEIGFNYRLSNVLAAIGRGQLHVLEDRVKRRREIFDYYFEALRDVTGIEFMPEPSYSRSNRWLTVILITPEEFGADREAIRLALNAENIESRPVWKPMHMQPVFQVEEERKDRKEERKKRTEHLGKQKYEARAVGGDVAEDLFTRGFYLPSGTAMTEEDLDKITSLIRQCKK